MRLCVHVYVCGCVCARACMCVCIWGGVRVWRWGGGIKPTFFHANVDFGEIFTGMYRMYCTYSVRCVFRVHAQLHCLTLLDTNRVFLHCVAPTAKIFSRS